MKATYLRQAMYAFAMGDAFGVPYEFKDRDTYEVSSEWWDIKRIRNQKVRGVMILA